MPAHLKLRAGKSAPAFYRLPKWATREKHCGLAAGLMKMLLLLGTNN
jgi:hypothetical protein